MCATRAEAITRMPPDTASVDWIERAEAIAPRIAAAADGIERTRRLPPDLLTAMHDAALFRMMLPRSLGGGEVDLATFVRAIETVAREIGRASCRERVCPYV